MADAGFEMDFVTKTVGAPLVGLFQTGHFSVERVPEGEQLAGVPLDEEPRPLVRHLPHPLQSPLPVPGPSVDNRSVVMTSPIGTVVTTDSKHSRFLRIASCSFGTTAWERSSTTSKWKTRVAMLWRL
jgi:hypothetical protein